MTLSDLWRSFQWHIYCYYYVCAVDALLIAKILVLVSSVGYYTGWKPSVADCGYGMSARCTASCTATAGPIPLATSCVKIFQKCSAFLRLEWFKMCSDLNCYIISCRTHHFIPIFYKLWEENPIRWGYALSHPSPRFALNFTGCPKRSRRAPSDFYCLEYTLCPEKSGSLNNA